MKLRKFVQGVCGLTIFPLAGAMLFLGMALVPFSASRGWLVFSHMTKNAVLLLPRLPFLLWTLWTERSESSSKEKMSLPMVVLLSVFGMPFIVMLLLLDDHV